MKKHSSGYARSLIEASLDPLITISSTGKIMDMNQATADIIGLSKEEITDSDFFDYFTEPHEARNVYKEVFERGSVANSPLTLRHVDGKLTDVLFNGSVFKSNTGKVLGVVIVARDVTGQKRVATELLQTKEAAIKANDEAQEAKSTAQAAMRKAEEAVRAKQQFLSNMSHEIRTPMNAIIGMSHLALQTELDSKQRNYIEKVKQSAELLLGVINDILDFSKMEAGHLTIEHIEFNLEDVLDNLSTLIYYKAEMKGLELLFDIDTDVPVALIGDPLRLGQILVNLANNAVKFTQHGEISLRVSREQGNDEALLQFSLRDTGIGIPQDAAHKLFQRFRQIDESPTRKYLGMGLGLAMSKRLVELMGGRIGFDSTLGQGSTFWFTVLAPARSASTASLKADRPKPAAPVIKAAPDGAHSHSGQSHNGQLHSGTRILLVEDNPVNQVIGATILRKAGMMVDIAADGAEALAKLQSRSYAAVLMDSQMPVMDGITATREIRKLPGLQALPIIALSANCEPQQVVAYLEAGMNDHLVKPIDGRNLLATLKRWIAQ